MSNIESVSFEVEGLKIAGGILPAQGHSRHAGIIYLQGAPRKPSDELLSRFAKETIPKLNKIGFTVMTFKFPGTGDSEGSLSSNSLALRIRVAEAAYDQLINYDPSISGRVGVNSTSISGHIALRLTEKRKVKALVLDSPAAYGREAEDKLWDGQFTEVIRKPQSWANSPAFSALRKFDGDVLLFYADHDDVIPLPIQEEYKSIVRSKRGKIVIIPDSVHRIHGDDSSRSKEARAIIARESERFFDASLH